MALIRYVPIWMAFAACASSSGGQRLEWPSTSPIVTVYSEAPMGPPAFVSGQPSPALASLVEIGAKQSGLVLRGDGRLANIARLLAGRAHPGQPATPSLLELAAAQLGVYDPIIESLIIAAPTELGPPLTAALARRLETRSFTHYGAVVSEEHGKRRLTLVLSERRLSLAPVPRAVRVGEPIRLQGRLPEGYTTPRVDTQVAGARTLVPAGSARAFSVQLPTQRAGLQRIEILGDAKLGSVVLGKLAIYVDVPAPRGIELATHEQSYDPAAIAARIFASINRERQRAGLPPLARESRLDLLAQQHSADMRDHDFVAHTSPRSGNPSQRVSRAGLSSAVVLETLARGGDPAALEAGTSSPAGELRNLLSRTVTHVGIGVVALPAAHGTTLLATELFVQLTAPLEADTALPKLLASINQARVRRGSATVALDPALVAVAKRAAERFVNEPGATEASVLAATEREFDKFSLVYRRVSSLITLTARLDDAATLEPALSTEASAIGLGIAQDTRAEGGSLVIVLLVGSRR